MRLDPLRQRYTDDAARALLQRAEFILARHERWNAACQEDLRDEAARLEVPPRQAEQLLKEIRLAMGGGAGGQGGSLVSLEAVPTPAPGKKTAPARSARRDPAIEEFLRRANAAIATERGLTARCRLLLDEIAGEMKLSVEQRQFAMSQLTNAGNGSPATAAKPRAKGFHDFLTQRFQSLASPALNAAEEHQLIETGVSQFHLDRDTAGQMVREVRESLQIEFVSQTQALRTMRQQLADELARGELSDEQRAAILQAAAGLGLSQRQIDELEADCRRQGERRLERQATRRQSLWRLVAWGGVAVAAIVALYSLSRHELPAEVPPPPAVPALAAHAWWSPPLVLRVEHARLELIEYDDWLNAVRDGDEPRRRALYRQLFGKAVDSGDEEGEGVREGEIEGTAAVENLPPAPAPGELSLEQQALLADIVAGWVAAEPSAAAAEQLLQDLIEAVAVPTGDAALSAANYIRCEWAVQTLLLIASQRGERLRGWNALRQLQNELGVHVFSAEEPLGAIAEKSLRELQARHYLALRRVAQMHPYQLKKLHEEVIEARAFPPDESSEDMKVAMLCNYIESAGTDWMPWQKTLIELVRNADRSRLTRFSNSLARCRDGDLKDLMNAIVSSRDRQLKTSP